MKSKFILTEDESKRILSLHKLKIKEERQEVQEVDPTWNLGYTALAAGEGAAIGAMTFGPIGAVVGAVAGGIAGYLSTASGNNYEIAKKTLKMCRTQKKTFTQPKKSQQRLMAIAGDVRKALSGSGWTNLEDLQRAIASCDNIVDFCYMSYTYNSINAETLWNALDGDIDDDREWGEYVVKPIKRLAKNTKVINPKKTGCPSIVKSFTDAGYTQITEKIYKELAGDKTRVRKYKFCPVTKKNLYFSKPQVTQTGPAPTPVVTGGGGQIYPFDYDTILRAFPEEDIINPFGQGGEGEIQSIKITDKMYGDL